MPNEPTAHQTFHRSVAESVGSMAQIISDGAQPMGEMMQQPMTSRDLLICQTAQQLLTETVTTLMQLKSDMKP